MSHKLILFTITALLYFSCEKKNTPTASAGKESIEAKIFLSEFGGYGYDILVNDTVVIHQPHIPALDDNLGFPTEESAKQVAGLVIAKIRNHEMPPSVTREELIKFYLSE